MTSLTNARTSDLFAADIEAVKQIATIPTMLEVICRTTGMRFAVVARVTEDRWIACSVRDDIAFGLRPGGELKVETTICNKIRASRQPVIIDNVAEDENYAHHQIPKMYGFQSYISFPIILKNGEFFGTLCAIDPKPAQLNNPKVIGLFTLFSELLSFQLQEVDLLDEGRSALQESGRLLNYFQNEKRHSRHQLTHILQEPLRKIKLYSDHLMMSTEMVDVMRAREIALEINSSARELTAMIRDLTDYAGLSEEEIVFETVDLNKTLLDVCSQLGPVISEKKVTFQNEKLPIITAVPLQMAYLFFHLISNALEFCKSDTPAVIGIRCKDIAQEESTHPLLSGKKYNFFEILIECKGIEIEKSELENVFDIFTPLKQEHDPKGFGASWARCRRIVHNHGGIIAARSAPDEGTSFSIILPVDNRKH